MPEISIVILTWNSLGYLEKFFPVLLEHTPGALARIIVADNGSTDGTSAWISGRHPGTTLITFDKNLGYAGGYKKALESVDTPYALLLNSDVEVTENWLGDLLGFMEAHPDAGAIAPKILSYHQRDHFEYAGAAGGWIDRYGFPFCRGRIFSSIEKDTHQYDQPEEAFWTSGACLMVRMEAYRQAGGFDPLFFAHMEEIDLCWRMHAVGYEVWYFPGSWVYHVGGGTLPNEHPYKLFLNFRNNLVMLWKNLPVKSKKRILFTRSCFDGIAALQYLVRGKLKNFRAVWRAHNDYRRMVRDKYGNYQGPMAKNLQGIPGFYNKSIVFGFFLRGVRLFRDLQDHR